MVESLMMTVMEITLFVSVVICFMLLLTPLFTRIYTAKWRYWIWLILATRLLIPFNLTIPKPMVIFDLPSDTTVIEKPMTNHIPKILEVNYSNTKDIKQTSINRPVKKVDLNRIFSKIWLLGILIFYTYHFISYLYFKKTIQRWGYPISNMDITYIFKDIKRELNISEDIEIQRCIKVSSPMMTGFIKPILLLPREDYSKKELSVILKHELIHYKRYDIWYKLILLVANAVHWFNPLVYIMVKYSNKDMEISCDAEVVKDKDIEFRKEYSQTILDLIHGEHIRQISLSTYFNGGKRTMKDRLINILDMQKKKKGIASLLFIVMIVVASGTFVACNKADSKVSSLDKTISAENADEAALIFSENLIQETIKKYEEDFDINIIDKEIIFIGESLKLSDLTEDGILYVYNLQYKLKLEDPEKIVSSSFIDVGDGWIMDTSSGTFPIILGKDREYVFISNMSNQDFIENSGGDRLYAIMNELHRSNNNNVKIVGERLNVDADTILIKLMGAISQATKSESTSIDRLESKIYDIKYIVEENRVEFMAELISDGKKLSERPLKFIGYGGSYQIKNVDLTEYDSHVERLSDKFPIGEVPCHDLETGIVYRLPSN